MYLIILKDNIYHFIREGNLFKVMISINFKGKAIEHLTHGNGILDDVTNAINQTFHLDYQLINYMEHSLESSSKSEAAAYASISINDKEYWDTGINDDIIYESIHALISAINNSYKK